MQTPFQDWLLPDWPAPASVQALCSTRLGGHSCGAYAGLNLGLHVGDAAPQVLANRQLLQARLAVRPVFMDQVHGSTVLPLQAATPDGLVADAAITTQTGLACTVMVADCLPVLFCDAQGRAVAAAHAGWRGLLGVAGRGVLEITLASLRASVGQDADILAWLGPCIGPKAFEVGDEVRAAFVAQAPQVAACFVAQGGGKWLADLPALARQRLAAQGVAQAYGNDGSAAWCTFSNPSRFFSHRRDRVSGRLAACVWRSA